MNQEPDISNYLVTETGEIKYSFFTQEANRVREEFYQKMVKQMESFANYLETVVYPTLLKGYSNDK